MRHASFTSWLRFPPWGRARSALLCVEIFLMREPVGADGHRPAFAVRWSHPDSNGPLWVMQKPEPRRQPRSTSLTSGSGEPAWGTGSPASRQGAARCPRSRHSEGQTRLRHPGLAGRLRPAPAGTSLALRRDHPAQGEPLGIGRSGRERRARPYRRCAALGQAGDEHLDGRGRDRGRQAVALDPQGWA